MIFEKTTSFTVFNVDSSAKNKNQSKGFGNSFSSKLSLSNDWIRCPEQAQVDQRQAAPPFFPPSLFPNNRPSSQPSGPMQSSGPLQHNGLQFGGPQPPSAHMQNMHMQQQNVHMQPQQSSHMQQQPSHRQPQHSAHMQPQQTYIPQHNPHMQQQHNAHMQSPQSVQMKPQHSAHMQPQQNVHLQSQSVHMQSQSSHMMQSQSSHMQPQHSGHMMQSQHKMHVQPQPQPQPQHNSHMQPQHSAHMQPQRSVPYGVPYSSSQYSQRSESSESASFASPQSYESSLKCMPAFRDWHQCYPSSSTGSTSSSGHMSDQLASSNPGSSASIEREPTTRSEPMPYSPSLSFKRPHREFEDANSLIHLPKRLHHQPAKHHDSIFSLEVEEMMEFGFQEAPHPVSAFDMESFLMLGPTKSEENDDEFHLFQ